MNLHQFQTSLRESHLGARSYQPLSRTSRVLASQEGGKDRERLRPVISPVRPPRQSTAPPQQLPVDHSSAYILRNKRPTSAEDDLALEGEEESKDQAPFTGNALQWYLRRVDKSFDDGDQKPSAAANAYYKASQTQAGQTAVKGIGSVAGTAVKIGGQAVKAAAPVGKWALLKGLGAAGRLIVPSGNKGKRKEDDSG